MTPAAGPLGRLPFLFAVTGVNVVGGLVALLVLALRPSGNGHYGVLLVYGGLFWAWYVLHARRRLDAGLSQGWARGMALAIFIGFALGYMTLASLWSVPEVREEAFRTGGTLGALPLETNALVREAGLGLYGLMGLAGALLLVGLTTMGMLGLSLASFAFTMVTLFASPRPATERGAGALLAPWRGRSLSP